MVGFLVDYTSKRAITMNDSDGHTWQVEQGDLTDWDGAPYKPENIHDKLVKNERQYPHMQPLKKHTTKKSNACTHAR